MLTKLVCDEKYPHHHQSSQSPRHPHPTMLQISPNTQLPQTKAKIAMYLNKFSTFVEIKHNLLNIVDETLS